MGHEDYSQTHVEVNTWFPYQSCTFTATALVTYLLIILKIGPAFMKNRTAYDLKSFILVYNIGQVLACIYSVYAILNVATLRVFHFWECQMLEPNSRTEYDFNRIANFVYWLKFVELSETIVFVLRKKFNQVSFLHVFHHCATLSLVYLLIMHYRNISALYPIVLNCIIHVIMYSYYLFAAIGSAQTVQRLIALKKSVTILQMVQFVMILGQVVFLTLYDCNVPKIITAYYCCVVCLIFYGFYDFYKKSYVVKAKK